MPFLHKTIAIMAGSFLLGIMVNVLITRWRNHWSGSNLALFDRHKNWVSCDYNEHPYFYVVMDV